MPVKEIFLLRHGHRLAWSLDPTTGKYTSSHPFPTRLPADPPLASHGVRQAQETGAYLEKELGDLALQDRVRIYSSLFYRCLETLRPTAERLRAMQEKAGRPGLLVRGERGVGEWFGKAWFEQPHPATSQRLKEEFFPWIDDQYESLVVPHHYGERIEVLHDRVAEALAKVTRDVDLEYEAQGRGQEEVTIVICGHAAQIIASGRALTGAVPEDLDEDDFHCYTCGLSRFVRRAVPGDEAGYLPDDWREGKGVAGGWDCMVNSGCEHLAGGEERGWHFHGDESFDSYGPPQALEPKTSETVWESRKRRIGDGNDGAKL